MLIGYARVSTDDQDLSLQNDALVKAGCNKIYRDTVSGAVTERAGLTQVFDILRQSDTLVVWRLDRLGRSLKHLIALVDRLDKLEVGLCSLTENIDTTSAGGKLIFHIFGALAEFERHLIRERTRAGLAAARARGRQGGRPVLLDKPKKDLAIKLYQEQQHSIKEICGIMNISRSTLYNYIGKAHTT
ncbi:MAG: recombinase family protein [Desulfuromonadaceae bacterium]